MDSMISWSKEWEDDGGIAGDRRSDRRYRIRLDVRWKLIRRRKVQDTGTGQTLDISSGGILFETDRELPVGLNVEMSIVWPVLLRQMAPMQLVVSGRIVRSANRWVAVRMTQHEFRTAGMLAEQHDPKSASTRGPNRYSNLTMPNFSRS
jgi:hypothetical protein